MHEAASYIGAAWLGRSDRRVRVPMMRRRSTQIAVERAEAVARRRLENPSLFHEVRYSTIRLW